MKYKVGDEIIIGKVPTSWWFDEGWVGLIVNTEGSTHYIVDFPRHGSDHQGGMITDNNIKGVYMEKGPW